MNFKSLRWIWQILEKRKAALVILVCIQIINGFIITTRSFILKDVIDFATKGIQGRFVSTMMILIVVYLFQLAILSWYRHLQAKTQYGMEMDLKYLLFHNILEKKYEDITAMHSGEWNQRMTSDTAAVASLSVNTIPGFIGLIVRLFSSIVALFLLVPTLVIIMIPFGICLVVISLFLKRKTKRMYHEIQDADGKFRVFLQEHLSSLLMIKAFNKKDVSLCEGKRTMDTHFEKIMKRNTFMIYIEIFGSIAMNGMYLLGVLLGGYGILHGNLSYGTFSAILTLVMQAQSQVSNASSYFTNIFNITASAERLMEIESFPEEIVAEKKQEEVQDFYQNALQAIEFRNITFSYKDQNEQIVFVNKSFCINKGEFVALTGESGCGKSTILKILLNIYSLDKGECVLVGKKGDIQLDASWRNLFAYVPQGNMLMAGSIQDVVTFGEVFDKEKMEKSLEIACAKEFVQELENGIHTILKERGNGLSEGQMQRLSLARAIYSDRPILLLDESTSALDQETEQKVLQNIRQMTEKTVIIVTHRMATFDYCDRVIHFE